MKRYDPLRPADAVHQAVKEWLHDPTNREEHRGPEYHAENLAQYLNCIGFKIVPIKPSKAKGARS